MKLRKLLRYNQDTDATITICDGTDCYTYQRDSLALEKYMHRKVLCWHTVCIAGIPWISIYLEKEAEHGR
jgi:hypothetical protein